MDFASILENKALFTLSVYVVVLVPLMLLGFFFAWRKMFTPHHKFTMTLVVILNWTLIGFIMAGSYSDVAGGMPDNLSESYAIIATIHGLFGLTAQLMATYLVLLMWTENTALEKLIPFRIKRIKTPMRITLSLWLLTVLLGFGVYGIWYGFDSIVGDDAPPAAVTEEAGIEDESPADPSSTEEAESEEEVEEPDSTEETDTGEDEAPEPDTTEEAD